MKQRIETASYQRIQQIGKFGALICTMILISAALLAIAGVLLLCFASSDWNFNFAIWHWNSNALGKIPSTLAKLEVILVAVGWLVFRCAGIFMMRQVFIQFTKGEILSIKTAHWVIWSGVWNFLCFFPLDFSSLLNGLFILLLGWAMKLASAVKEDQDFTV